MRAGRVQRKGAALAYEVALTRGGGGNPDSAVLQIGVSGLGANGAETRVLGKPLPLSIAAYGIARGTLALPRAFAPARPPSPCSTGPTAASSACASSM